MLLPMLRDREALEEVLSMGYSEPLVFSYSSDLYLDKDQSTPFPEDHEDDEEKLNYKALNQEEVFAQTCSG